jgi:hypothetical protein
VNYYTYYGGEIQELKIVSKQTPYRALVLVQNSRMGRHLAWYEVQLVQIGKCNFSGCEMFDRKFSPLLVPIKQL